MKFRRAILPLSLALCVSLNAIFAGQVQAREYRPGELSAPILHPLAEPPPDEATPPETPPVEPTSPAPASPTPTPTIAPAPTPKSNLIFRLSPKAKPESSGAGTTDKQISNTMALRDMARALKLPLPLPQARVVICKSKRTLELWSDTKLVKRYRVALGAHPLGPKARQGDNRTPEGRFSICTRNNRTSAFHIFLGLSYPNLPDIERGLRDRQISPREYQLMRGSLSARGAPLWQTNLGGWVGIHGGDDGAFAARRRAHRGGADWTAGCIALSNAAIEEVFAATRNGTPVEIRP